MSLTLIAGGLLALPTHGALVLQNGSFELPSPVPAGNNFDVVIPSFWTYVGTSPYPRIGSGGFGYPAATDGTTMYAVEGDGRNGVLFQDLGTMTAGQTYVFNGTVLSSSGINSYRVAFIGDPTGSASELAFITDADFAPGVSSSLPVTFSCTAGDADSGDMLRLELSANGFGGASRSAFDALSISTVPEPVNTSLLMFAIGGTAIGLVRRYRSARRNFRKAGRSPVVS